MRIYNRARYGTLAEFPVLDGRQYRAVQACPTPTWPGGRLVTAACAERDDPSRSMLGAAQEAWLFDGFRRAGARWNIIAQDLLVAPLAQKNAAGVQDARPTAGTATRPAARACWAPSRIALANPVFLGGDIHSFWATDLKADFADPADPHHRHRFVGTSITSNAPTLRAVMASTAAGQSAREVLRRPPARLPISRTDGGAPAGTHAVYIRSP